ncbi:MAG: AHH domain-containing protein [Burkholderiales bacterium]
MAGHTEGLANAVFCSLRKEECPCGNKYQDIMKGTESWGKYPQRHRVLGAVNRSPEAHHVLPVASVTGEITARTSLDGANNTIKVKVVENTKWCVNDLKNMIALPLFEMTFLHYLIMGKRSAPPPFASLPMHNYDHAAFQKEVGLKLKKIGKDAAQNTKDHEEVTKELLAALNALRDEYNPELASRGTRGKGTHGEFTNAMDAQDGDPSAEEWYIPFSMADEPSPKPFPSGARKGGLSEKLAELIKAWGGS